ncbi:MAG: hypothetical protein II867_00355 [Clostridia bacterium]|nr:hypothetical protein [Clostridia bacterium]
MKIYALKTVVFSLALAAVLTLCLVCAFPAPSIAYADGKEHPLYTKLNDALIALYEEDIAHEPVVSNIPAKRIDALANKHGFSLKKTKSLIIISDLALRTGNQKSFNDLAKMKDREIFAFGKSCLSRYLDTLTQEEKDILKQKALDAIK